MPNLAKALESGVVDSYRAAIEEHVKESHYTDALEKLIDFVRDCSPGDRVDAISLYARYTRWKAAERRGVSHNDNINEIIQAILEMTDVVAGRAHIADEVALSSADVDVQPLRDNIIIMSDATAKERPASADVAPLTGQILSLPPSDTQELRTARERATDQSSHQQKRLDADVPLAGSLSDEQVKSELSHQKLDQVRQTYLDVWRNTRKRRDDTLLVQARDLL
jgi:hypothetical protein